MRSIPCKFVPTAGAIIPYLAPPPPLPPHVSPTATCALHLSSSYLDSSQHEAPPAVGYHLLRYRHRSSPTPSPWLTTWPTHPCLVFSCHARHAHHQHARMLDIPFRLFVFLSCDQSYPSQPIPHNPLSSIYRRSFHPFWLHSFILTRNASSIFL